MKKALFSLSIIILFCASLSSYAQVFEHKELANLLGYHSDVLENKLLTQSERIAIEKYSAYSTAYYEDINPYLRGQAVDYQYVKDEKEMKFLIKEIDSGLSRLPALPKNLVLFRGEGLSYRGNKPHQLGEIISQLAYISTSSSLKEAKDFITLNGTLFILYSTQKKFKGIVMNEGETEVLLPRAQFLKIMKTRRMKDDGRKENAYVALVQVCETKTTCESHISNPHALKIWENDEF